MTDTRKIWEIFPRLTERIYRDHAEVGMIGGHHDADHAVRVAQMAFEIAMEHKVGYLAGAAGLCHNADRILQKQLGIGRREVPRETVAALVRWQLRAQPHEFGDDEENTIIEAVLKHDGKNSDEDSPVLIALMDADRLVNAEPDLIIRCGQYYHDLPAVDPFHLDLDPDATYRDPRSVFRDLMETITWLTPGTPFYVRLPKARELAAERKKFFDAYREALIAYRKETGFFPYPPALFALREKYMTASPEKAGS